MKNSILLLPVLFCFLQGHSCAPAKNDGDSKKITVQLIGKSYDKLYLETYLFRFLGDGYHNIFTGSSLDGYRWEFHIPDSIYQKVQSYALTPELYDTISKTVYAIKIYPDADSQMEVPFFPNPDIPIRLIFQRSEVKRVSDYRIVQDSLVWVENAEMDIFTFNPAQNKEMAIACEMESAMMHSYENGLSLGEQVYRILDSMIIKYPESKFLTSQIGQFRNNFSRQQVTALYNKISETEKASYAGELLKNIIDFDPDNFQFTNVQLPAWDTHLPEFVITDTTKPTLIIFSASWCGPCHAMVPMLKEVFAEKGDDLNMVYISIDTEKYAEGWKKFMKEQQIPWRSLILLDDPLGLRFEYNLYSIPKLFFVESGPDLKSKWVVADTYAELKNKIIR